METASSLKERIIREDNRPHTIEELRALRKNRDVGYFLRRCKTYIYTDDYGETEEHESEFPSIEQEFDLDRVGVADLCDAIDYILDEYNSYEDPIVVYRVVSDYRGIDFIDHDNKGLCWARSLSGIRGYLDNQNDYLGSGRSIFSKSPIKTWTLYVGTTSLDNVDWMAMAFLSIWGYNSSEEEIRVWDASEVNLLKRYDLSSEELHKVVYDNYDNIINWKEIEFPKYTTTGNKLSFEQFKNIIEAHPKSPIKAGMYYLLASKETDRDWLEDFCEEKDIENNTIIKYFRHNDSWTREDYTKAIEGLKKMLEDGSQMQDTDKYNWVATALMYMVGKPELIEKN